MTTREPFNEKKSPMTNTTVMTAEAPSAGAPTVSSTDSQPTRPGSNAMYLIHEALSRVRTRSPQKVNSEARRSALRIAMEARHQQSRELGNLSQYGIR